MNARQFLERILPSTGVIFTATPVTHGWNNMSHPSIDAAVARINDLTFRQEAAYFAVATYAKDKYWDEHFKNPDGTFGKWRTRTQSNAQSVKSFFLDLDVDAADPLKFASKEQAIAELRTFVLQIGLPQPMIIDSGGGIHAYWPLAREVPTADWRPVADQFKNICVHEKFRVDRSVPADQARVLRAFGSFNVRRGAAVKMLADAPAIAFEDFARCVSQYGAQHSISAPARAPLAGSAASGVWDDADNLGATNDPLHFDRIVFHCAQLQAQVAARGRDVGEQLWRAALGIVKFCEPAEPAWRAVSDGHPEFSVQATLHKLDNWRAGPTACTHFHQHNPSQCEACPHWQKITSPAQLGRIVVEAPAPVVTVVPAAGVAPVQIKLPNPPKGYTRSPSGAVVFETENQDGTPVFVEVSPYDLYPLSIGRQNGLDNEVDEASRWRAHLPLEPGKPATACDFSVPSGLFADSRALAKLLFSQGIILVDDQPKLTQRYMGAYLQKLASEQGRERIYERLGWHDDRDAFVLGTRAVHADGTVTQHNVSANVEQVTKGGMTQSGTLDGWKRAMQFYARPGYEAHRFFIYCALGAPLLHMSGHKGIMISAVGESGRGKTTCLKACSSIWGTPDALVMNGNANGSTVNGLRRQLGITHSLPFLWDDITERNPKEVGEFLLEVPQGTGKQRLKQDGTLSKIRDHWETIVLASSNVDEISRQTAEGKDSDAHLKRHLGIEFTLPDTSAQAKTDADNFLRALAEHHGHVGAALMSYVCKHYAVVMVEYTAFLKKVDRDLAAPDASAERFWAAAVAAACLGAAIAERLGLLPFSPRADYQWMTAQITAQRAAVKSARLTPVEHLVEFLNANLRGTIAVSSPHASNLANVVVTPYDKLIIHRDLDAKVIYVAARAADEYFAVRNLSARTLKSKLKAAGIVLQGDRFCLGAGTVHAVGQSQCWKIDATKLDGLATPQVPPAVAQGASNVVPITGGKAA
ncbi:DUF927 domain-containing protein [Burkholderia sp. JKS000303]|uniref:DUF927 domain-containing protein n=1 Tax=Burkholderia sp. JKS000303 TaxID=1938747 RepID=UPI000BF3A242|nr:DUF927 domain-containing protein [Burkholderia sp. JKS000303]PFH12908.1 uncharacterized protein DUF927 [Burkholderia sp. JKS000303]